MTTRNHFKPRVPSGSSLPHTILAAAWLAVTTMAVFGLIVSPALAQGAALPNDAGTLVNYGGPLSLLLDSLVEIAITILVGLALVVSRWLKAKFDVDVENSVRSIAEKHRATLHSALETGVNAALIKFGITDISTLSVDVRNQVIAEAVRWARDKGATEAVEHFGASFDDLSELALSKLGLSVAIGGTTNIYAPALESTTDLGSAN